MALVHLLPKTQRNAGTWTSPSRAVPPGLNNDFRLIGLMDQGDIDDAALTVRIAIEASYDVSGNIWSEVASVVWTGGYTPRPGHVRSGPFLFYGVQTPVPTFLRLVIDHNKRISAGLDVDIS